MMSTEKIKTATEAIYHSLVNDNEDIDQHIAALKTALREAGEKTAIFDPTRLYQNNRQGRKIMQSYFKKHGVIVEFKTADA